MIKINSIVGFENWALLNEVLPLLTSKEIMTANLKIKVIPKILLTRYRNKKAA